MKHRAIRHERALAGSENKPARGVMLSGIALSLVLGVLVGCAKEDSGTMKSKTTDKKESTAFAEPETTSLGQKAASLAADRGGDSGFLLMDRGRTALAWRTILADSAENSIDAQYFLWKNDEAGKVMMHRLMSAADRGVRVRVLIDDSMTDSDPQYLAKFGAYPNIELRLYKPFGPKHKSMVMRWIGVIMGASSSAINGEVVTTNSIAIRDAFMGNSSVVRMLVRSGLRLTRHGKNIFSRQDAKAAKVFLASFASWRESL